MLGPTFGSTLIERFFVTLSYLTLRKSAHEQRRFRSHSTTHFQIADPAYPTRGCAPKSLKAPRAPRHSNSGERRAFCCTRNWSHKAGRKSFIYRTSNRSSRSFSARTSRVCLPSRPCTVFTTLSEDLFLKRSGQSHELVPPVETLPRRNVSEDKR